MIMSEKSKQHVDSCRFCWMCHHICPIGNATGQERNTARARALGISLVNRGAAELSEIMDNIYECSTCGGCVSVCVTGWDPVMFTKETRLQAALEDKLPTYINTLVDNCLESGNAYGKTALCDKLSEDEVLAKAQFIIRDGLSVRETEKLVKLSLEAPVLKEKDKVAESYYKQLERKISETMGRRVSISRDGKGGGKLALSYGGTEDLEALLKKLCGKNFFEDNE